MKEVVTMTQRSSDGQQEATGYRSLVSLPLPGPAVVIDMRSPAPQDRQLVWNMATEIEDLSAKIRLFRVNRWRYLQQWIEFITLGPLPPGETVDTATSFTLKNGASKIETFSSKERLIEHIHRECIDRVRTNRNSALRDGDQLIQEAKESGLEKEQATVRVFFIIDIADSNTFNSAAAYASMLRQKSYQYDDPQRSGRNEPISPVAICINTDKAHRDPEASRPQFQLPEEITSPVFDMMMLVHAYDDTLSFMSRQAQLYELELILYAMLLSPASLTTDKQEMRDEDPDHYLSSIESEEEAHTTRASFEVSWREMLSGPSSLSPVLCMIGTSSFEYSARWGMRWLDYGLVKEILGTLCDSRGGRHKDNLHLPNDRDWLDDWWTDVKKTVPIRLNSTMQEFRGLVGLESCIDSSPFQGVSLRNSGKALTRYCQEIARYYSNEPYAPTLPEALTSADLLFPVLQQALKKQAERGFHPSTREEEEIQALVELEMRAKRFPFDLFRGATGAISHAINQITELEERVARGEIGQLARNTPNIKHRLGALEDEIKKAEYQQQQLMKTWKLPLIGEVQRASVLAVLLALLAILFVLLLQNHVSGLPGTGALFAGLPGLSPLFLGCCVVAAAVALFFLARHNQQLYRKRERIIAPLQELASTHLQEVQSNIAAKTAILLLKEAGLYHPEGKAGLLKNRLRALQKTLVEAQQRALEEQKGAYERLKPIWSQTTDPTSSRVWLNQNSRKDLLLWNDILEIYQRLKENYATNNPSLNKLAELLLKCLEGETYTTSISRPGESQVFLGQAGRREQLHHIGTELVAILLSEAIVGSRITTLYPLLEKYLALDNPGSQGSSALGRHMADLYEMIKVILLEQAMTLDSLSQFNIFDDFGTHEQKTVEQIVAAWIEYLRSNDEAITAILNQDSIMSRLGELKLRPAHVLEDLSRRCRLLGLPREVVESDHSYFLLAPEPFSDSLIEAVRELQPTQLHLVPFPDQEKLIYLHLYQIRLRASDNFFLT